MSISMSNYIYNSEPTNFNFKGMIYFRKIKLLISSDYNLAYFLIMNNLYQEEIGLVLCLLIYW